MMDIKREEFVAAIEREGVREARSGVIRRSEEGIARCHIGLAATGAADAQALKWFQGRLGEKIVVREKTMCRD